MPAIDTQAPLMRRKALIEKLMAQLGGGGQAQGGINAPQINLGRPAGVRAGGLPSTSGAPMIRPGNLEPRSALIPGLQPPPFQAINQGAPEYVAPAPAPTPAPAPAPAPSEPAPAPAPAPAEAWQTEGFVSAGQYALWNSMSPEEQARILANPVSKRRFFA